MQFYMDDGGTGTVTVDYCVIDTASNAALSGSGWFTYAGNSNCGSNMSKVNPSFVNPPSNLHVGCTSSCLNAGSCDFLSTIDLGDLDNDGVTYELQSKDIGGASRIQNSHIDIGAFESSPSCGGM